MLPLHTQAAQCCMSCCFLLSQQHLKDCHILALVWPYKQPLPCLQLLNLLIIAYVIMTITDYTVLRGICNSISCVVQACLWFQDHSTLHGRELVKTFNRVFQSD
eukprot:GHUV01047802.1.p1 GENE.GHUV01047802.1~~GHUV01047802.1.p1  ORF type:complete len:104 (+),score=21.83 GHUV01047802.1:285-596(+)